MKQLLMAILVASLVCAGCGKKEPSQSAKVSTKDAAALASALARVNSWTISADEFDLLLNELKEGAADQNIDIASYEIKKRILEQLVRKEALYQIGLVSGLGSDTRLNKLPIASQKAIVSRTMMRNLSKQVVITEEELKDFYEKNRKTFSSSFSEAKEEIRGFLIRIKTEVVIVDVIEGLGDKMKVEINYDLLKSRS